MFFLEVDPSVVKPGWTPLIITILLAAAIALLMISMRRQIRKISVPHRDEVDDSGPDGSAESGPGGGESGDAAESDRTPHGTTGERHPIANG